MMKSVSVGTSRPLTRVLAGLVMAIAVLPAAAAAEVRAHDPRIGWVPGWVPHPGFFVLSNESDRAVTVTGARSTGFARIEFKAPNDGDLFMNEPLDMPLSIPPGGQVTFKPGGSFLMLWTQDRWLEPGERVVVEFLFENRSPLPVEFVVKKMEQQ